TELPSARLTLYVSQGRLISTVISPPSARSPLLQVFSSAPTQFSQPGEPSAVAPPPPSSSLHAASAIPAARPTAAMPASLFGIRMSPPLESPRPGTAGHAGSGAGLPLGNRLGRR